MSNAGRSTTGGPAVPYYLESPQREAAKYLRLTVARFLSGRASQLDVDRAIEIWNDSKGTTNKHFNTVGQRFTSWELAHEYAGQLADAQRQVLEMVSK